MSEELTKRVAALAFSFPKGSEKRAKLIAILAAAALESSDLTEEDREVLERRAAQVGYVDYTTDSGTPFKMKSTDFAQMLREQGIRPGPEMGSYLRGEKDVPDAWVHFLKEHGAKIRLREAPRQREWWEKVERGPDISRLWDMVLKAMAKQLEGYGADAGDYFINMPASYSEDQFEQYLAGLSGDIGRNWKWDLKPRAKKWWSKLDSALQTGEYKGGGYENWDRRHREQLLGEIYADYWHDALLKGWRRLQRNPGEMARLRALRPS